jgi:hypothetical protein
MPDYLADALRAYLLMPGTTRDDIAQVLAFITLLSGIEPQAQPVQTATSRQELTAQLRAFILDGETTRADLHELLSEIAQFADEKAKANPSKRRGARWAAVSVNLANFTDLMGENI